MQWIVTHELELCLVAIYIRYQSVVDSLQRDVESTLELDSQGANILIGPNGPHFKLIYYVRMVYEDWIDSKFTFMYKGVLVITQVCIGDSE